MKILLIQLYDGGEVEPVFPLGVAYLAASLTAHEVRVFDQNVTDSDPFLETERLLFDFSPDVVGVSIRNVRLYSETKRCSLFTNQLSQTIGLAEAMNPRPTVVVGGAGFSMFPTYFMSAEPAIDFGVFLEGEQSFPQLLDNLSDPSRVPGIYYRSEEDVRFTGGYSPPDFEQVANPQRDIVDLNDYSGLDTIGVLSKRGCILGCCYCSYPFLSGHTLRVRPPSAVVDEIEQLAVQYGVDEFTFADNTFNVPVGHADEICREIVRRQLNMRWSAWFNERNLNLDSLRLAARAGCRVVELSPDGYSNSSLKWLNKNIRHSDVVRGLRLIKQVPELSVFYNFMIGIPGQGPLTLLRLWLFIKRARITLGKRFLGVKLNVPMIEPNTVLRRRAIAEGRIKSDDELFEVVKYESGFYGLVRALAKHNYTVFRIARTIRQYIGGLARTR